MLLGWKYADKDLVATYEDNVFRLRYEKIITDKKLDISRPAILLQIRKTKQIVFKDLGYVFYLIHYHGTDEHPKDSVDHKVWDYNEPEHIVERAEQILSVLRFIPEVQIEIKTEEDLEDEEELKRLKDAQTKKLKTLIEAAKTKRNIRTDQ